VTAAGANQVEPFHRIGKVPIRNIWLLFLYASDLARFRDQFEVAVEDAPDLSDLLARLLCFAVERRLRRNLSRGYRQRAAEVSRVRGRIDVRRTYTRDLPRRGMVACRFQEHTFDTPRNRLVRAALEALGSRVMNPVLAHECHRLAEVLGRQGVCGLRPSRAETSADQVGRHDVHDLLMVSLAKLTFDLALPTDDPGALSVANVDREEALVRRLFERAIGNFYASEFPRADGWIVSQGRQLDWQSERSTPGIATVLPGMITDIIVENKAMGRRWIIDTKFTGIFGSSLHRETVLKSGYLYQIYAYVRSQENPRDPPSQTSTGILLHPAIGVDVDERVTIQGHEIRFATVDLTKPSGEILEDLRRLVDPIAGG
jgi:5-methylcytosine-specific restriction enzyme subunit McrC